MRSEAWRPAAAARNRSPREARDAPGEHYDSSLRSGAQNRHGGAPRGERPVSWDARRLARRLACRDMARRTGVPPSTRTSLGAPPTLIGVSEARMQDPGAKTRRGNEEDWLFDM